MFDYEIKEDSSGNFEVYEHGIYNNCYGDLEKACDWVLGRCEVDNSVSITYKDGDIECAVIDDLKTFCYQ
jgi:hypothetical protein